MLARRSRSAGRLFRAETGTTPARFLKSLRMQQAKDLLEHSVLATREIIRRVG
jgi:transcriptional regulator GlxA family with amidase domain